MITDTSLQVLPAVSDNATLYLSMQPASAGRTTSILSATALTYNPFSKTLSLNGIRWPASDGTVGQYLRTDGAGNLSFATVVASGGGLTNFTDTISTVSPNNVIPVATLTATNVGYANIDIALVVKGTGAILAQVPDGNAAGGNKRGTYSVDFQMSRSAATQVANSTYSFIGSGQNNTVQNGQTHAIVTGTSNLIESVNTGWKNQFIGGGNQNTITYSNSSAIVGGQQNSVGGGGGGFLGASYVPNYQFLGGGYSNVLNADRGVIVGGDANWNSGPSASILGGQNGRQTSYWGAIAGGYANQAGATQFQITFFSQSGKANIALSADNASIKAGLIFSSVANNGSPVFNEEAVLTYIAAGSTFATTGGSGNGTTYTLTHASGTYAVDSWITIAGVTLTSGTINGTYIVTGSSAGSVSFGSSATGTISIQGTVKQSTTITATMAANISYNNPVTGGTTTLFYPGAFIGGGANNQATGLYSIVVGGGDRVTATNRNTASGDWSFTGGGQKNTNSGSYATLSGGYNNQVSGGSYATISGGSDNYAGYNWSTVAGGRGHQNNMAYGAIMGGSYGDTRAVVGFHAFPACFAPIAATSGVSQGGLLILARQTTDATATVLRSDNSAASSSNQIALPSNSAYYVKGSVIATVTAAGATKAWTFECVVKKALTNATTSIVGTAIINITAADSGASTWTIALSADTTNGALAVTVTGQVANTIRWVCKAETTEVTF